MKKIQRWWAMIKHSRQVLNPMSNSVALTLLVIIAVRYLLLFIAAGEYLAFGAQHIVDFYRAIGIAEPLGLVWHEHHWEVDGLINNSSNTLVRERPPAE